MDGKLTTLNMHIPFDLVILPLGICLANIIRQGAQEHLLYYL